MPLYVPSTSSSSSGSPSGLATFSIGHTNYAQLDLTTNNPTYGGIVIPGESSVINQLMVYCLVAGSGNVQAAVYDANTKARLGVTNTVSCSSSGFKAMTLTAALNLTAGTQYFLAASSTSNGSRFAAFNTSLTSFSVQPYPAFNQTSAQLPATIAPVFSRYLLWVQAY